MTAEETPSSVKECPLCAGDTIVVDSRTLDTGEVWRRRKCLECGKMFHTKETFIGMVKSKKRRHR